MAKLQNIIFLKDSKGQSAVEYILLLAVLSSIGYAFYQNKNFKDFIKGEKGLFASLEKRMEYSYRYGRELDENVDLEEAMAFKYQTNKHDTYYDAKVNQSRFFSGLEPYGKK